ncbi:MAG: hypothetical protein ABI180_07345 [Microcoleus sp.]
MAPHFTCKSDAVWISDVFKGAGKSSSAQIGETPGQSADVPRCVR